MHASELKKGDRITLNCGAYFPTEEAVVIGHREGGVEIVRENTLCIEPLSSNSTERGIGWKLSNERGE